MNQQPIEIQYSDLNFTVPIVASDGNMVMINEQGPVNLVFFQMRQQASGRPGADVVAAVRLHSIEELENLGKQIEEITKQHRNRER